MNIAKLKILFCQLEEYLKEHVNISIQNQYLIVCDTIAFLNSDESNENKFYYTLRNYKALFTGKGGLTEFYVWNDDFDKRQKINQPLEIITDELWTIFKDYV